MALTLNEVWIPSPNYSSRDPSAVRLLVLHTTEGATTIRNLGNFFASSSAGVSSHSGSDNYENFVFGAYVDENNKAWTQGNANPYCISLEQCTPSGAAMGWSRDYWLNNQEKLLRNGAYWLAYMSARWNIPLVSLSASQAQGGSRGVCDHVDLGSSGGGHVDCGPGYPMDQVIAWAKEYAGAAPPATGPAPPSAEQEDEMPVAIPPGPDAPHVGVSFSGTPYKTVGFCGDDTVFDEVITIRCAFHKAGTGATWSVQTAYVDRSHNKVVINIPDGTDGASFQRQDSAACVMYPNFGT